MENNLLQKDDIVFQYGNYGVYDKLQITRVTPTMAFAQSMSESSVKVRMKRQVEESGMIMPIGGNGLSHYKPYSDKLEDLWFDKKAIQKLNKFYFNRCNHSQLVRLLEIIDTIV